jgi:hypothetical protein
VYFCGRSDPQNSDYFATVRYLLHFYIWGGVWLLRAANWVLYTCIIQANFGAYLLLWCWWLVAGLSPRRLGFDPGSVHVIFVVDRVALDQVFLRVLRFSPVSIILPVLHNHISDIGEHSTEKYFHIVLLILVYKPLNFKKLYILPT